MDKEEDEEDDADDKEKEEEIPLSERALNLESRLAQEERHCTIVAIDFYTLILALCFLNGSISDLCYPYRRDDVYKCNYNVTLS